MRIVFDTTTMQVGCALLQAQYGALDNEHLHLFPTDGWLLAPNSTMGVYEVTEAQLQFLIRKVKEAHGKQTKE